LAGAVLTGVGYSLVYPGLGVEAVRRVPPESRGLAMRAYTTFSILRWGSALRHSVWSRARLAWAPHFSPVPWPRSVPRRWRHGFLWDHPSPAGGRSIETKVEMKILAAAVALLALIVS